MACSKDDTELYLPKDEVSGISLHLGLRGSGSEEGLIACQDPQIRSIRVMVFSSVHGVIECNKKFVDLRDMYEVPCQVGKGKAVYVIANEPSSLTSILDLVLFVDDLSKVMQPEYRKNYIVQGDADFSCVLAGRSDRPVDVLANVRNRCTVNLVRAYSKISVRLKKAKEGDRVTISEIGFNHLSSSSCLIDQLVSDPMRFYSTKAVYSDDPLTMQFASKISNLYVYDQIGHSESDALAPMLYIKAKYNDIPTVYKAYITNPASGECRIDRNTHFQVNGVVASLGKDFEGLLVKTHIVDWMAQEVDNVFDYGFAEDVQIDGRPYDPSSVIEIKKGVPVKITLKVHGYTYQEWKASLGDAIHFSLAPNKGVADGTTKTTMTLTAESELGSLSSRPSEITFTLDGKDVLLGDGGSRLVIKIKQTN